MEGTSAAANGFGAVATAQAASYGVTVGGARAPSTTAGSTGSASAVQRGFFTATDLGGWGISRSYVTDPDKVKRLTGIRDYINQHFDGSPESLANIANTAVQYGVNQAEIADAMGYLKKDIEAVFANAGIPKFAAGGDHLGGARIVGERGPELELTGPSRIFNASQTRSILQGGSSGADNAELLAEMRAMRAEMAQLRADAAMTAAYSKKTSDTLVRVTRDGDALVTTT